MIDPQSQGNLWTKNMEGKKLQIADIKNDKYIRVIEECVKKGKAVMMPDIGEDLDPVLDSVLSKSFKMNKGRKLMKIGDREIEYNDKFRLFITTRMSNPTY